MSGFTNPPNPSFCSPSASGPLSEASSEAAASVSVSPRYPSQQVCQAKAPLVSPSIRPQHRPSPTVTGDVAPLGIRRFKHHHRTHLHHTLLIFFLKDDIGFLFSAFSIIRTHILLFCHILAPNGVLRRFPFLTLGFKACDKTLCQKGPNSRRVQSLEQNFITEGFPIDPDNEAMISQRRSEGFVLPTCNIQVGNTLLLHSPPHKDTGRLIKLPHSSRGLKLIFLIPLLKSCAYRLGNSTGLGQWLQLEYTSESRCPTQHPLSFPFPVLSGPLPCHNALLLPAFCPHYPGYSPTKCFLHPPTTGEFISGRRCP